MNECGTGEFRDKTKRMIEKEKDVNIFISGSRFQIQVESKCVLALLWIVN